MYNINIIPRLSSNTKSTENVCCQCIPILVAGPNPSGKFFSFNFFYQTTAFVEWNWCVRGNEIKNQQKNWLCTRMRTARKSAGPGGGGGGDGRGRDGGRGGWGKGRLLEKTSMSKVGQKNTEKTMMFLTLKTDCEPGGELFKSKLWVTGRASQLTSKMYKMNNVYEFTGLWVIEYTSFFLQKKVSSFKFDCDWINPDPNFSKWKKNTFIHSHSHSHHGVPTYINLAFVRPYPLVPGRKPVIGVVQNAGNGGCLPAKYSLFVFRTMIGRQGGAEAGRGA